MESLGSSYEENQPSRQIPALEVTGKEKPSQAAIEQWSRDRTTKLSTICGVLFITLVTLIIVAKMQEKPILREYVRHDLDHIQCGSEGNNGYFYKREELTSRDWLIYLESSTEVGMDLSGGGLCAIWRDLDATKLTACKELDDARPEEITSFGGILSLDAKNQLFQSWNTIVIPWCSGFAFTSNRTLLDGFTVEGGVLIDEVLSHIDYSEADRVVLAGSGTGGLQALLRASTIKNTINNNDTQAFVLADSAFFLDTKGDQEPLKQLYYPETAAFLSSVCTESNDPASNCLWPKVELSSQPPSVPIFIVQSWYDCWNLQNILEIDCFDSHTFAYKEESCGSDINDAHDFRLNLERTIGLVFFEDESKRVGTDIPLNKNLGFWVTTCPGHGFLTHDDSYLEEDDAVWTVLYKPLQTTIREWMSHSLDDTVDVKSYMLADQLNWTDSFVCPERSNPTL